MNKRPKGCDQSSVKTNADDVMTEQEKP